MDEGREERVDRPGRHARRWRTIGLLTVAAAGWIVAAGGRAGRAREDGPGEPRALVEQELELSRLALQTIDRATQFGVPAVDQASEEASHGRFTPSS